MLRPWVEVEASSPGPHPTQVMEVDGWSQFHRSFPRQLEDLGFLTDEARWMLRATRGPDYDARDLFVDVLSRGRFWLTREGLGVTDGQDVADRVYDEFRLFLDAL